MDAARAVQKIIITTPPSSAAARGTMTTKASSTTTTTHARQQRSSSRSPRPWYHHLTLDTLTNALSLAFFHPIAFPLLAYLSLAAVNKHKTPLARAVIVWSVGLWVWRMLAWLNRRLTYGKARRVDWADEVVVITGGATGLGATLVDILVRRGVAVAVLDVVERPRGEMREWVDGKADEDDGEEGLMWCVCDVGLKGQVESCMVRIRDKLGTPTILINNAARPISGLPLFPTQDSDQISNSTLSLDQISQTLTVNTLGHFHTLSSFLPGIISSQKGATIITISSILAHLAPANLADYAASKAAISSLQHTLTHEIRQAGQQDRVKTVLVEVGQMATDLFANIDTPWYAQFVGPVLEVTDVAKAIVRLIDEGNSGVVRLPVYATLMVWYGAMPGSVQRGVRWFSGIDQAVGGRRKVEVSRGPDPVQKTSS